MLSIAYAPCPIVYGAYPLAHKGLIAYEDLIQAVCSLTLSLSKITVYLIPPIPKFHSSHTLPHFLLPSPGSRASLHILPLLFAHVVSEFQHHPAPPAHHREYHHSLHRAIHALVVPNPVDGEHDLPCSAENTAEVWYATVTMNLAELREWADRKIGYLVGRHLDSHLIMRLTRRRTSWRLSPYHCHIG